jgi:plastocyanin
MKTTKLFSRFAAPVAVATIIGLGLTACSSSGKSTASNSTAADAAATTTPASPAPAARSTTIAIQGFMFKPSPAGAKVGDTITVTNGDGTNHSLTADDGSFDTGKFSGGSKTITLTKAGTFTYHCQVHNYMTGTIQVSG